MPSSQQQSAQNDSKSDSVVSHETQGPQSAAPVIESKGRAPGAIVAQGMANPGSLSPNDVLQLQRAGGNQATSHFLSTSKSSNSTVQRSGSTDGGSGVSSNVESSIESARGSGSPLPKDVRGSMEQSMGADFSGVRVHTGGQADTLNRSIQARAFTTGNDVFFRSGEYNPGSRAGKELLAHELTHTIQQGASSQVQPKKIQAKLTLGPVNDKYEQEADAVAKRVVENDNQRADTKAAAAQSVQRQSSDHIQRDDEEDGGGGWGSWLSSKASSLGSGLMDTASSIGSATVSGAKSLGSATVSGAKSLGSATVTGAKALGSATVSGAKWVKDTAIGEEFNDFDGKQYRVSGTAPNRIIEEVKRTTEETESGQKVVYVATGRVTGFEGSKPVVTPYDEPVNLGDWYPSVTHVNGMNVNPEEGLTSAQALHSSVNEALKGKDDVAMGQDAIDVLYTYSAKRGNPVVDVIDCIKGKIRMDDEVTGEQSQLMLDAVHRQKRVTVSAHSRGTIKTDNAVRATHQVLTDEYKPEFADSPEAQQAYDDAYQEADSEADVTRMANPDVVGKAARDEKVKQLAEKKASEQMDQYIQLIYAGNAVDYPSSVLKVQMFVGGKDPISMGVGTYTETGMGMVGHEDNEMVKLPGKGHGFDDNYAGAVGASIATDLTKREDFKYKKTD